MPRSIRAAARPSARAHLLVLGASLLLLAGAALAAPATKFEPTVQAQNATLQLNGSGTRVKAIFKVYDMALYTERKVKTPEELVALPGAKRIQFTALRELPGTELGRLFLKGIADNSPKDQVQKHTLSTTRLIEVFSGRSKMAPGETFAMEFVPGKGTTFFILGQAQGAPIGDAEFFGMVLKIWVGENPADRQLKAALLGQDD